MSPSRLIWLIMGGLLVWGLVLALGTFLVPGKLPAVRALIVFGCTALFIAFWGLMLLTRHKPEAQAKESDADVRPH